MECVVPSTEKPTSTARAEEVDSSPTEPLTSQDDTGTPGHPSAGVGLVALTSGEDETVKTLDNQTVDDASPHFIKKQGSAPPSAGTVSVFELLDH